MKWFNFKNWNTHSRGGDPVRPEDVYEEDEASAQVRRCAGGTPNFNRLLFIGAVFAIGILFVRTGFVQSDSVILSQDTWTTEDSSSIATLPVSNWTEYDVRDDGVVVGDDLHLESAGYSMTQTSDDGVKDTCTTENCSTGGGFNGATAVKSGTVIANTGVDANIRLGSTTPSSSEFSQNFLGSYDTSHKAKGVAVSGNYAYVADEDSGLHIIDISTPATPVLTGTYNTPHKAKGVAVSGNYAYVADEDSGLQIIDISIPASPTLTGTYNTPHKAKSVAVSGNYAYVADESSGLQIIDISTPATPVLIGTYNTPHKAKDVAVSGNYAYVADEDSGLQIIDISTPATPTLTGTYDTPNKAKSVAVLGNYAYVADDSTGLVIINISTPSLPTLAGTYLTTAKAKWVAVEGNFAYVAIDGDGLVTIDITTPSAPTLLATYDTPHKAKGVFATGFTAYIADEDSGLQIIQSAYSSDDYFFSGTFESPILDLGSSVYNFDAAISDMTIPADSLPVGSEIALTDSGLIALWHMNSADALDSSITDSLGTYSGVLHATPIGTNTSSGQMWDVGGNLGSTTYTALEFDGTNDYVSIGNLGTNIKTIMFWIKSSSPTSGDVILELNGSQSISIAVTSGDVTTSGIVSPTIYVDGSSSSATLSSGWHHVAIVTSTDIVASSVNLGRVVTSYMDGLLDEVAIYNREVSSNEITKIYNGMAIKLQVAASNCSNGASNAPNCSANKGWGDADTPFIGSDGTSSTYLEGSMALYHFNEGFGTAITDASGYGHNGTLTIGGGGDQSTSTSAWANGTIQALTNLGSQGLAFDGTDDYVAIGDIRADIKSVEFWIDHSGNTFGGVILELNATQSIVITTSNKVTAVGFVSPTIYVDGSSSSATLSSGWHHVAVVTATSIPASDVNLGRVGAQYMIGSIDEVALYDWVLSASEIRARYNNGSGKAGAVFGQINSSALDNKQYVKYKAFMGSASMLLVPQIDDVTISYSAFPSGAGLVSSVFDTGDASSFLTDISWSETLDGHDVRVQVATSGDGLNWNYCGVFDCSINDWIDFSDGIGSYYTKSTGNIPNNQSANAYNDRYIKYKVWLMSDDGTGTPTVEDITITHDTAHLEVFASDGISDSTEVRAETPFNIIITVKDSSGNVISSHDGSRTIKLTASKALLNTNTCVSSFSSNGYKELSRNVVFFSGEAMIANVMLCDDSVNGNITISAVETIGGALKSTADLTISDIKVPEEKVTATLYWDPLIDCTNFNHYEVWYGVTSNVTRGIGNKWDETSDPAMAICSTSTTTITDLLADTQYYFSLFAIDNDGNAISMDVTDSAISADEELINGLKEDAIDEENVPEGTGLYEILIKIGDNHHSDPVKDARGSYKHGDVIVIMPAGHDWSKTERDSFLIIEMYLTEDGKRELMSPQKSLDGETITKRREKGIDLKKMGLSKEDKKDMKKRKKFRKLLKGKKMSKKKIMKNK